MTERRSQYFFFQSNCMRLKLKSLCRIVQTGGHKNVEEKTMYGNLTWAHASGSPDEYTYLSTAKTNHHLTVFIKVLPIL